jgi:hypothetical protein
MAGNRKVSPRSRAEITGDGTRRNQPEDGVREVESADGYDQLESWKEIATFIDRDQRTAMRWAKQGMPVRRVPPDSPRGRVFGSKTEISRWLEGQPEPDTAPAALNTVTQPGPAKRFAMPIVASLIAMLVLGVTTLVVTRHVSRPQPARIRFYESAVEALDAQGHHIWNYRFSRRLDFAIMKTLGGIDAYVRIADFRGDGSREVVLVAPFRLGNNPDDPLQTEVDCFSETGNLLWSYIPRETLRFGDHEISGPWIVEAILVSDMSAHRIWVASNDVVWGNSSVVSLDALTGRAELRFVNTGSIHALNELRTPRAAYLLAGGFNNEYDGASFAVVDESRPFAASPQTAGTRHQCMNCPAGVPIYYFVFPRSELNRMRHVYETPVTTIAVNQDRFTVSPLDLFPDAGVRTLYEFVTAPAMLPVSLRYSSTYETVHRDLERTHQLDHTLAACPERLHPLPVKMWTPSGGWTEVRIKPVD